MDKIYTSLGLMSGTSLDGVDASIIRSDGEKVINIEKNEYFPYNQDFRDRIREFITQCNDISYISKNQKNYNLLEKEITLLHAKVSQKIIQKFNDKVDLVGFHGQTIIHRPEKKYSIQMGDAKLLSQILKKKIIYNFRENDIKNKGSGAPLASIYHYNISKKINLLEPIIFLNIGGISNITFVNKNDLEAKDIGPGNVLIDEYIKKIKNQSYDKNGEIALTGKIDFGIVKQTLKHEFCNVKEKHSFDRGDFDYSFIRGLSFENALATITYFTSAFLAKFFNNNYKEVSEIIVCGGGRKNKTLIDHIKNLTNKKITMIDELGINGDYIESQAFAYLSIRSFLKKNISFPSTTKVLKPVTGGILIKNF